MTCEGLATINRRKEKRGKKRKRKKKEGHVVPDCSSFLSTAACEL
jgi:hypothetical protein